MRRAFILKQIREVLNWPQEADQGTNRLFPNGSHKGDFTKLGPGLTLVQVNNCFNMWRIEF